MNSHRAAPAGARALVMPGISLFVVHAIGDGCCAVRCPACHAEAIIRPAASPAFAHADDACPIARTIAAALEAFDAGEMETCA